MGYVRIEELINLVNHELWIEYEDNRAYLKWGHYPKTDGRLDPLSIKRAFVLESNGVVSPAVIGFDEETYVKKQALFLEFRASKPFLIGVEYDRGLYTVTKDGKWVFGGKTIASMLYRVEETRWIVGYSKTYVVEEPWENPPIAGFELEIVPTVAKVFRAGEKALLRVLYRGKPVKTVLTHTSQSRAEQIMCEGVCEATIEKGVNVFTARYVDETPTGVYDKRHIISTLTLYAI